MNAKLDNKKGTAQFDAMEQIYEQPFSAIMYNISFPCLEDICKSKYGMVKHLSDVWLLRHIQNALRQSLITK